MSEVWDAENSPDGVTIRFSSGSTQSVNRLEADQLQSIMAERGINRFTVSIGGITAGPSQFPVVNGFVDVKEYNEAK